MDEVAATVVAWPGSDSMWRRMPALIAAVGFLFVTGSLSQEQRPSAAATPSEYDVKAAFLLNFTKFIEWPAEAEAADAPFTICVVGEDPFGSVLDRIVEGERVGRRNIAVRRVGREAASSCNMLFIGKSERESARLMSGLRRGVLTVGETDGFLRDGGVISFVVENRRVRFDVDERTALRNGLKISSRLLNVARSVER